MNMSKVFVSALVLVLSLASVLVTPAGAQTATSGPTNVKDYANIDEGQYHWGPVYEVASGSVQSPKVLVGPDQDVVIVWASNTPDVSYAHLDKDGDVLSMGPLTGVNGQGSWDAAVGPSGLALVWTVSNARLMFQGFDLDGSSVTSARTITVDSSGILSPSVAVASDGTVYISYIVARFGGPIPGIVALRPDGTTKVTAIEIDIDGKGASMVDMIIGPGDSPFMLVSTSLGTYITALDRAGKQQWHSLLYASGAGQYPTLSEGNDALAGAWLDSAGTTAWVAVFNPQGANIARSSVPVTHVLGPMAAVLDNYGVLHLAFGDGASIYHIAVGVGQGVLFDQPVAIGSGPSSAMGLAADPYGALYMVYLGTGLFYAHADTYAIEVGFNEEANFNGVHPGKTATGSLTITNTGGMVDAIGIQSAIMPSSSGWTPALSSNEVYLQKDGTVSVPFSVKAPQDGNSGDSAILMLHLWTMSMPDRAADIEVPLKLLVDYGVSLSGPAGFVKVPPGLSEELNVTVRNDGEVSENIYLSASSYGGTSGWHLTFSMYHLILDPGQSQDVTITIQAPYEARAGETIAIDLGAMVEADQDEKARVTFYAVAESDINIDLQLLDDNGSPINGQSLLPGTAANYVVKVTNTGRSSGKITVSLEVISGMGDWQVYLAADSVMVSGGASVLVPLTVIAPRDGLDGARFVARVSAKGVSTPVEGTLSVVTFISKVSSVSVGLENRYSEADPGSEVVYNIKINNKGNGVETLSFRSETPFGWEAARFYIDGMFVNSKAFNVGEKAEVQARIKVPQGTSAGDHELTLVVLNGHVSDLEAVAHVNMVSDLWFSSDQTVQEVVDGKAEFGFKVRNYGNGPDEVHFTVDGLANSWKTIFPEIQKEGGYLSLNPGKEEHFTLDVQVPENVHNSTVEFNVHALPMRGDGAVVRLLLKIIPTDLEIIGTEFGTGTLVKGDIESISVRIRNNGPGPAGAILVRAEDNGRLVGEETLVFIRAGSEGTATFTWAVTAGHHDLKFKVDPNNRIYEREEGNNEALVSVNAIDRTAGTASVPIENLAGGAIVATFAIAGAAAVSTEAGRFKLMWLFWVPLYTKLKKHSILDHFVRGQVYGYIKANPGEHYNAIKKALALKNGTLVYHLQTLEREEYVKSVSDGRFKRFYPAGMKVPEAPARRLNKIQEIILELITERPGISQKEIAEDIGLSGATINYHINVMLKVNAIKVEKVGRTTHAYALDEGGAMAEPSDVETVEPDPDGPLEPEGEPKFE